jgi:hypothetical protein
MLGLAFWTAIYGGICLWMYIHKPIFFNEFGFHERMLLPIPIWLPIRSEVQDTAGSRFFADFRLNVFVVVQILTEDRPPHIPEGAKSVELVLKNGQSIKFKLERDSLIQIRPDGTIHSYRLAAHQAEQLFRVVEESTLPDRSSIVEQKLGIPLTPGHAP